MIAIVLLICLPEESLRFCRSCDAALGWACRWPQGPATGVAWGVPQLWRAVAAAVAGCWPRLWAGQGAGLRSQRRLRQASPMDVQVLLTHHHREAMANAAERGFWMP